MKRMKSYLIVSLAVAAGLVVAFGKAAYADCSPDGDATAQTITCDTADTNGVDAAGGDDTININAGANVNNTVSGLEAVDAGTGNDVVNMNNGTVNGANNGIQANNGDDTVTVSGGSVSGAGVGVNLGDGKDKLDVTGGTVSSSNGSGIDANTGNDSVTITNGTVTGTDFEGTDLGDGDDTLNMSGGTVTGKDDGIEGNNGNDNITVSGGKVTGQDFNGIEGKDGDDTIIVNGTASVTGLGNAGTGSGITDNTFTAASSNDQITVGGSATVQGNHHGVNAGKDNDTITIQDNATVQTTGANTSVVDGGTGNDTITVKDNATLQNSATAVNAGDGDDRVVITSGGAGLNINGILDGGAGYDVLQFTSTASTPAQIAALLTGKSPAGGTVTIDGKAFTWRNFEELHNLLGVVATLPVGTEVTVELAENVTTTESNDGPPIICQDGQVKVFLLSNGDLDIFSGFWLTDDGNGFLVGRVSASAVNAGQFTFADMTGANPGWYVQVTAQGNSFITQVFDNLGNPIGNGCNFSA